MARGYWVAIGLLAASLVGGCADSTRPTEDARSVGTPAATSAPPTPPSPPPSLQARCGLEVPGDVTLLPAGDRADGDALSAAVLGDGERYAVLVHQVGREGLCGWLPYATWLADQGVTVVAVDLCGYGQSRCGPALARDYLAQLRVVVDWARADGATSVTLVGASMGGSVVVGMGQEAGADALVDLSGPPQWSGVPDLATQAPRVTVPLLVVAASGDQGVPVTELEQAVTRSPAEHKRFLRAMPRSHGWGTLTLDGYALGGKVTEVGRVVAAWVKGKFSA